MKWSPCPFYLSIYSNRETLWSNKQAFIQQTILYWINVVHRNMNSPNNCFVRYLFYYYFIMCLAVWAQQAFGDWMRPPSWAIGHTSINMSPGSDGLKVGYPAPVVRRTGIKWCYVCVPRRPHTTVVQLEACWPEVRGIAIYVHSNPEKNVHGEVRGIAIYVHYNPEKKIHGEVHEQQFMSTAIPKNVLGEVRGTAIYVRSKPNNVHGEGRGTARYYHNNPEKCP